MNEIIYRGMRDLVKVSLGKTSYINNPEYLELKKHFRYPGEVLERMEQYGYSSKDDYISAMEVILWMRETLSAEQMKNLIVGTQLEDFIKRKKKKAGDNIYLLYELYLYEKSSREQILTTQSNGEEFMFTRDEENSKKKTVAVDKDAKDSDFIGVWSATQVETDDVLAPADIFGVNNLFLSVKDQKVGLYVDIDNTDGIIDISDISSDFSDRTLSFVIGVGVMDEAAESISDNESGEYQDMNCTAQMLEDGTMKLTFSDSSSVRFIMEKSTDKELKAAKEAAAEKTEDQEKSEKSNSDKNNKEEK